MISCSFYPHYFSQLLSKITFLIIILSNFFPVYFFSLFLTKWLFLISIYDFFTLFWLLMPLSIVSQFFQTILWAQFFFNRASSYFLSSNISSVSFQVSFNLNQIFLSCSHRCTILTKFAPLWKIRWKKFPTLKCWDYAHFFQTIEQIDFRRNWRLEWIN